MLSVNLWGHAVVALVPKGSLEQDAVVHRAVHQRLGCIHWPLGDAATAVLLQVADLSFIAFKHPFQVFRDVSVVNMAVKAVAEYLLCAVVARNDDERCLCQGV